MVIQHNIAAVNSYRNLTQNTTNLNKNLEKLSSGFKINRAGDDAAGLAISESMRNKINALNQAEDNANDAIGLIQTAEGALTETHSMLERMTTLATQAANGTYGESGEGATARSNIKLEVEQLEAEIDRIANATTYNGNQLIDGSASKVRFQIGATKDEKLTLDLASMKVSALLGSSIADKMSHASTAASAIDQIKTGVNRVSSFRAKLGANQNRLEHTVNNLKVSNENLTSAESRIRDTDMAKEISAYTKNNILNQAAQSMLAQANQAPQGTLQLLQ